MYTLRHALCVLLGFLPTALFAVMALPEPIEVTQPNGDTLKIILGGDEIEKYRYTLDGYTLLYDAEGYLTYAQQDLQGELNSTGIRALSTVPANSKLSAALSNIPKRLAYGRETRSLLKQISNIRAAESIRQKAFPSTGSQRLLCILMQFQDKAMVKSKADFDSLFNQRNYKVNGATGSVRDYFYEASYGQLDLKVDVFGPYTATYDMVYYGGNNASSSDSNPRALISEAISKGDADINFKNYASDGINVDPIYVIFAGYDESSSAISDAIWAHAWTLSSSQYKDGVWVYRYSCSGELSGSQGSNMTNIGVICHEFGHSLGAPDYYDTNYATGGSYAGTGNWDLQASGSWNNSGKTPAHPNPYTKIYTYNWAPVTQLSSAQNISLDPAHQNKNSFYRIDCNTYSYDFYLLENRQKAGFDANIPGHGLVIYHNRRNSTSAVNATYPQMFYPVCASATVAIPNSVPSSYGSINSSGTPYPGTSNKTVFSSASIPAMADMNGGLLETPLFDITETGSVITATFIDDGQFRPKSFVLDQVTTSSVSLSWTLNNNLPVLLVQADGESVADIPNTTYSIGDVIPGIGKVIYTGSSTSYVREGLNSDSKYRFLLYTVKTGATKYSPYLYVDAYTKCAGSITEFPIVYDFERELAIPECFQQQYISGQMLYWGVRNYNKQIVDGVTVTSNMAYLSDVTTSADSKRLLLPLMMFDKTTAKMGYLKFGLINAASGSNQDVLNLYYKAGVSGVWTPINTYSNSMATYQTQTVELFELTDNYQIAFEGVAQGGGGIFVDDIEVGVAIYVETLEPGAIGTNSVTLRGNMQSVLTVARSQGIDWRTRGSDVWNSESLTVSNEMPSSVALSALLPGTEYEYRAWIKVGPRTYYGNTLIFKTAGDAPVGVVDPLVPYVHVSTAKGEVEFVSTCEEPIGIALYHVSGKLVCETTLCRSSQTYQVESGVYVVRLITPKNPKGQLLQKIVVK